MSEFVKFHELCWCHFGRVCFRTDHISESKYVAICIDTKFFVIIWFEQRYDYKLITGFQRVLIITSTPVATELNKTTSNKRKKNREKSVGERTVSC